MGLVFTEAHPGSTLTALCFEITEKNLVNTSSHNNKKGGNWKFKFFHIKTMNRWKSNVIFNDLHPLIHLYVSWRYMPDDETLGKRNASHSIKTAECSDLRKPRFSGVSVSVKWTGVQLAIPHIARPRRGSWEIQGTWGCMFLLSLWEASHQALGGISKEPTEPRASVWNELIEIY